MSDYFIMSPMQLCSRVFIYIPLTLHAVPLVAQMLKNLPAMRDTRVLFLGWEGPLEKGIATHSSILAWRIPWTV